MTPTGDLAWEPQPYVFTHGATVRYIDFEHGDDAAGGDRAHPWKHHPWDAAASAAAKACQGPITYVFKRGVIYRGELDGHESGAPEEPIRLTSDPSWGEGEAVISGAEIVSGWTKGAARGDIPDPDRVWKAHVACEPRNVWLIDQGEARRIDLARLPHWTASDPEDPKLGWWKWQQPQWWLDDCHRLTAHLKDHDAHIGVDIAHLTLPPEAYVGAIVRTEFAWVMSTPFPTIVEGVDPATKGLIFQGIWFGNSEHLPAGCRYYLEDRPQFLSDANEFWAERDGRGGATIYLRLPGDADPNAAVVEAARACDLVRSKGFSHIAISGLTFRTSNTAWDLWQPAWGEDEVDNAAIRVQGPCVDLTVDHCRFVEIGKAVSVEAPEHGRLDAVTIADNDIERLEHGAICIAAHQTGHVAVLRNRLREIGWRAYRQDWSHAISVSYPVTMEVAGNDIQHCYGSGIFVLGAKGDGDPADAPLERDLVHHNRVVQSLLSANDWGGIETWQGGPHYVYNNISGDVNGMSWGWNASKPGTGRAAYAYYLDGSCKNYLFNDVAWGGSDDWSSKLASAAAIYEASTTIENEFFNDTFARFYLGSNWSPGGGRHLMLGNLWLDVGSYVFHHGREKEDSGPAPSAYPSQGLAYSHNVFAAPLARDFGVFEADSRQYADPASMAAALASHHALGCDVGTVAEGKVVKDLAGNDFHPVARSGAEGRGVRVFVPWGLARTVGEWHFRRTQTDPITILDAHWYMAPYYGVRDEYHATPCYSLATHGVSAADFIPSPLEDWLPAALRFNGRDQDARVADAACKAAYRYTVTVDGKAEKRVVEGDQIATPDITTSDLLIELHLQADRQGECILVEKMGPSAGYRLGINRLGGISLTVRCAGVDTGLASGARIADGAWHHALVEVDRPTAIATIYIDGTRAGSGALALAAGASLSNHADFIVGGGAQGHRFAGAMDYLRVARTTLADSQTSIAELYDWEFDGPSLRDFEGRKAGARRAAGAFDAEPAR